MEETGLKASEKTQSYLRPGVAPREVLAWAFLDFANSGYTTVVLTAVYSAFFVGVIAGAATWATLLWTLTVSGASLLTMFILPSLGLWADRVGGKRAIIAWSSLLCGFATAGLAWVGAPQLWLAVVLIAVSSLAFNLCETFTAAFLRELARPHAYGRVSGWGWSFGYLGGMLTLGLSLAWVLKAKALGQSASEFVPVTLWIVAVVYVAVTLPALAVLKERHGLRPAGAERIGSDSAAGAPETASEWEGGWLRLRMSWQRTESLSDLRSLLYCCIAFHAGIFVVVTLAAVYAEQVMGFQQTETMTLVFLVNIAAALGAFFFGRVQDRVGGRPALAITLLSWILMVVIAVLGQSRESFWLAATLAGLNMGSSQSAGRAMIAQLAPMGRQSEIFALWGFALRISAILGPVCYGLLVWLTEGQQRLALACVGLFFLLALWLLKRIDMQRGIDAAFAAAPFREKL